MFAKGKKMTCIFTHWLIEVSLMASLILMDNSEKVRDWWYYYLCTQHSDIYVDIVITPRSTLIQSGNHCFFNILCIDIMAIWLCLFIFYI